LEIGKTFYAPIKCFDCTKTGTETVQLRRWCVVRWSKHVETDLGHDLTWKQKTRGTLRKEPVAGHWK
jgi:hypothetical protein